MEMSKGQIKMLAVITILNVIACIWMLSLVFSAGGIVLPILCGIMAYLNGWFAIKNGEVLFRQYDPDIDPDDPVRLRIPLVDDEALEIYDIQNRTEVYEKLNMLTDEYLSMLNQSYEYLSEGREDYTLGEVKPMLDKILEERRNENE